MAITFSHASEEVIKRDNSKLSVFLQPAISFLNFEEREYFQNAIDTIYYEFLTKALTEDESLYVAKQDFQKVNFCFPITAGLQFQILQDNFISAGIGFIYDNESVVLTDRKNKSHDYNYTIQGVPLFLEYRLAIPLNLMTLSDGGLFSVAVRWYWTLPGTEIYTSWGKLKAENSIFGAGFGISLGYLIASWKGINIFGDIGFSSIKVKSKNSFASIVPESSDEKAKWDIGGLQLQIRVSFGVINKPKPIDEDSLSINNNENNLENKNDNLIYSKNSNLSKIDSLIESKDSINTNKTITENLHDSTIIESNNSISIKNSIETKIEKTSINEKTEESTKSNDSLKAKKSSPKRSSKE